MLLIKLIISMTIYEYNNLFVFYKINLIQTDILFRLNKSHVWIKKISKTFWVVDSTYSINSENGVTVYLFGYAKELLARNAKNECPHTKNKIAESAIFNVQFAL